MLYPLRVNLPRGFLVLLAACPVLSGLCLIGDETNPLAGVALLLAFVAATAYLWSWLPATTLFSNPARCSEAREERRSYRGAVGLTVVGILVIALGGELVAEGAGSSSWCSGCLVYSSAW